MIGARQPVTKRGDELHNEVLPRIKRVEARNDLKSAGSNRSPGSAHLVLHMNNRLRRHPDKRIAERGSAHLVLQENNSALCEVIREADGLLTLVI
jgi:hypothetical protein